MWTRWLVAVSALCLALPMAAEHDAQGPRHDQYGDPLPEGAVLRIGTVRLRPGGVVTGLAFTPDDKRLVTVNSATGGHIWDVATGKELRTFSGPTSVAEAPNAISADASLAAVIESASACRIYDTATGARLQSINEVWKETKVLRFSPDRRLLAAVAQPQPDQNPALAGVVSGDVSVWDVATGALLQRWTTANNAEHPVLSFSNDSKSLAFGSSVSPIVLWDVATGKKLHQFALDRVHKGFGVLTFSANGKTLAASDREGKHLSIWEVATGKELHQQTLDQVNGRGVGFTPDCQSFITGGNGAELTLWDAMTGKPQRNLAGRQGEITSLAFSTDGKWLATGNSDHAVRIWDFASGKELHIFSGHHAPLIQARFTSDGKSIVSFAGAGSMDQRTLHFWDRATGKALHEFTWDDKQTLTWCFSADGHVQANLDKDGKIRVRGIVTGKEIQVLDSRLESLDIKLSMTADGRYLLAAPAPERVVSNAVNALRERLLAKLKQKPPNPTSSIQLWDVGSGKLVLSMQSKPYEKLSCDLTEDGRFLIVHSRLISEESQRQINTLSYWNVRTGQRVRSQGAPLEVFGVGALSPSGLMMALLEPSRSAITVRELATGKPILKLLDDENLNADTIAFSPDGRTVATSTISSGEIVLWRLPSAEPVARLAGHRGSVSSFGFSPDGKRLVSGGASDTAILVWDITPWTEPTLPEAPLGPDGFSKLYSELSTTDAALAYAAMFALLRSPKESVALLGRRFLPPDPASAKEIAQWLKDLDSSKFAVREQASAGLLKSGTQVLPALERVLAGNPTLEVRMRVEKLLPKIDAQRLQFQRGLATLEMLGTPEAVDALRAVAHGKPDDWLTQEAAATLARVEKRASFKTP